VLQIENHYKPITAETVDQIGRALLAAKDEQARTIAMAEAAADALAPIAHYVKADSRACKRIEEACPGVRASVQRTAPLYGKTFYRARVWTWGPDGPGVNRDQFAEVHINLIEPETSVADFIAGLRACEYHRAELRRVENQFGEIEEIIDAEEKIRGLVQEIEGTREELAERLLGKRHSYFHDVVNKHLPGLAGR
jgi:hypothetical protein